MGTYVLAPRARADLKDIWIYTAERWNIDQADRYIVLLNQGIQAIAANPDRGRPCDYIRRGYRRYNIEAHVVFFRLTDRGVYVVRILHQRMDFVRHL